MSRGETIAAKTAFMLEPDLDLAIDVTAQAGHQFAYTQIIFMYEKVNRWEAARA